MREVVRDAVTVPTGGGADRSGGARFWLARSLRRLLRSPRMLLALSAVPVGILLAGVFSWLIDWRLGVDSAVYRAGAVALLTGEPLYDANFLSAEPDWALLPFTYPPTGALLFVPLALFPTQVAWGLVGAVSVLALAMVIRVCVHVLSESSPARSAGAVVRPAWRAPAPFTLAMTVLALALEPVWRTLFLGQINLILMAMVVLDVLVLGTVAGRARHLGGVLVGVAAAVKLTPLIFVPHLWLIGRRADAVRAVGTFATLQALLFVLIPHDFRRFWGHAVTDPERTGPTYWNGNQSLNGLILRLTDLASWSLAASLVVGAVLAVPAVWLALRFHRAGQPLAALMVTAFYGLLLSPVSWSHHWVWVVPLIVLLLFRLPDPLPTGGARIQALTGLGSVILVFGSGVLLIMRNGLGRELDWIPPEFVIGSAYLLVPVVAGVIATVRVLRRRPGPARVAPGTTDPAGDR